MALFQFVLTACFVSKAASFCTERSGHFDGFDQGLSFFLPNMTWLQPPGYVHQMIHETFASKALKTTLASIPDQNGAPGSSSGSISASSQLSDDGKTVYVRITAAEGGPVNITMKGGAIATTTGSITMTTLSGTDLDDANPPSNPTHISPKTTTVPLAEVVVPNNSFTILTIPL